MSQQIRRLITAVLHGGHVLLGDDQRVHRSLRVDVVEGHGTLVFVHDFRRNRFLDNLAKQTITHDMPS
jgi:hypothetical protein